MTSMSPEAIATAFTEASEKLAPCVGRPSDFYVQSMIEVISAVLVPVPFDRVHGGRDNLLALVTTDAEYAQAMGHAFTVPQQVGVLDLAAMAGATPAEIETAKALHAARVSDRTTFDAAVRGMRNFIINHVEEDWICTHRDPTFLYSRVAPRALINTLRGIATGRQETDRIALLNEI